MNGEAVAIEARDVVKRYPSGREALRGLHLEVRAGEILCLVGPNGAGKTTALRILGTQLRPTSGEVRILGRDLSRDLRDIRQRIAVVPQDARADWSMRVEECVGDYLLARGVPSPEARRRTAEILERFGMGDRRQDLVRELSGGLGQRVLLAMAFASGADLLMLDEPTAGLDPVARRQTWELLVAQKARGTILLTTHSMSEAEALADRVAILSGGRIIACDTPEMLRRRLPSAQKLIVEARLDTAAIDSLATFEPYAGKLALYPRDREALRQLMEITLAAGVEASLRHTTLEDVYIRLVGGAPGLAEGELQ